MSAVLEEIIGKVCLLSLEEQEKLIQAVEAQRKIKAEAVRRAFISSLKGKYRDVLSSTDEFMARKQQEIELEDKGWRPKQ